ncbi:MULTISPECIES: uracil-xanthine permease family protein [Enterobacteriaceae]|uniref:uracil-xanthine permease family protein n=1 Tax=Enterobacteriaceae TaxID=543 RepID=UPI00075567DD|nr:MULTISPECIES: nucleobase:cation symporter-2 family protein [Enterobacteriaceae]MDQ5278563.1 nucleobase:cation symporter-2 family protein [Klebsiella pneumoniae]QFH73104.1 purine permease [Enterobacter sp. E76]HCO1363237.1 purine permease [Escherichia coli]KVJ62228.1 uracil-xanthine permease [Enterobacter hormaechei subsp. steigerwaltii]MBJ6416739.1 purine permease [Enterobacter hormaechei]
MNNHFVGIDEKPPFLSLLLMGIQHVLVLFSGLVAVPLVVGMALGLPSTDITVLVQGSLIVSGTGTLIQCLGLGHLGSRLPICMGSAFVFIAPSITVGSQMGIQAVFGASMVCGFVAWILSFFIGRVQKLIPPLVTGTIVSLIGIKLLPLGFTWLAGGQSELYGKPVCFLIGGVVLVALLVASQSRKGLLSSFSVIIAIMLGYVVSALLGILDLHHVQDASWVSFPDLLHFGWPTFSYSAIVIMMIAQLTAVLESIGNTYGTGAAVRREITHKHLSGAISVDGIGSIVAPLLNGFPLTCFAQNIGVISITRVASRYVVASAGVVLIALGLIPKFSALVAGMPAPVLGGASLIMFGSIVGSGVAQIKDSGPFDQRAAMVFSTSLALGLGFGLAPKDAFDAFSPSLAVLLESGVAIGGMAAIILNLVLPRSPEPSVS